MTCFILCGFCILIFLILFFYNWIYLFFDFWSNQFILMWTVLIFIGHISVHKAVIKNIIGEF